MNVSLQEEKEEIRTRILSCYRENSGVWRAQSAFSALVALIIAMLPYYVLMFGQATYFSLYWGYWVIVIFADIAMLTAFFMFAATGMIYTAIQQLRGHETSFFSFFFPFRKFGNFLLFWIVPFLLIILFTLLPPIIFIGISVYTFLNGLNWSFLSWRIKICNLTAFCDTIVPLQKENKLTSTEIISPAILSWMIGWVRSTGILWAFPCMLMLCYFNLELSVLMIGHDNITTPFDTYTFWVGPPIIPSLMSGLLIGMVIGMLARLPRLALGLALNYLGIVNKNDSIEKIPIPYIKKWTQLYATFAVFLVLTTALIHVAVNMPIKGMRPLQLALDAKNYRLAHVLLHLGANPDGNDLNGFPPFSDVTGSDDLIGAQLLFTHGASTKRIAEYLPYWISDSSPEMKALFKKHGIEPNNPISN